MIDINPADLTERENYKFLIGSIIPRPIAFVTTQSKNGVVNGAPFSYFNIVTSNPPMISLAIQRKAGQLKDTANNLLATKEAVIHIVDQQNVALINETAANLPSDQSEVEAAGLRLVPSKRVSVPGIQEAKIRMEAIVHQSLTIGEKDQPVSDLFILEIKQFHVTQALYENGRIDPIGLGAMSRLAGNNYGTIGDIIEIKRPE
ncbi:flavin reductase family protein [Isobaculum melis]|uniref:NADH-FMN oxidoreductase RutF, flavin reductase (DIM6/NTAB) family n=1 Tax=Isobaculum melis TaxID=142588 RepID=A0A1H9U804_9LACT|nr:flavin reductase family protein [Isobaculum melis]SES05479.1 NADH-FMN oxidoreductase RutF, flavin reductase (DIM6/NTAB) family [Isobaculum melis]